MRNLLEIKFLYIKLLQLALDLTILRLDAVHCNETEQKYEFVEVEGWLHLLISLLIHHGPANRRVGIFITLVRLDQLVFVVELMLSIRDWRQSLLNEHFELLDVEQVWYEIIMTAQLKE